MRKVIVMNGHKVEHNGEEYEIKTRVWDKFEEKEVVDITCLTFKEVIDHLSHSFDTIDFDEDITEDEAKYLYFGFDGLKEKIDQHFKYSRNYYRLSPDELEEVLHNMTKFKYARLDAHFYFKPFLGLFGDYENLTIKSEGKCFFKPTLSQKPSLKIENSQFSYYGDANLSVGFEGKSLWLQIFKGSRKTIQFDFVPYNRKFAAKKKEAI